MQYVSTRGQAPTVGFVEAVLAGLAPDGGLYVPQIWPRLTPEQIKAAAVLPYAETAANVLSLFADQSLPRSACVAIAEAAYGKGWANPAVAPLRQVGAGRYILELFHGPSLAFKDVAMQLIAPLYAHVMAERSQRLSVVCATSGDTGGAAVEALKHSPVADLFILLPEGRVSDVQRRFMTASGAENVHALMVTGDFDDAQMLVKAMFTDPGFAAEVSLSPVNSINWARIIAQAVYYIIAASALGAAGPVDFVVPSGNLGDALAGSVARQIGAPVGTIHIATNANDAIAQALNTGTFRRQGASLATISPAMDISVASNFERIVYAALGGDKDRLRALYQQFVTAGSFTLPDDARAALSTGFSATAVDDAHTRTAMQAAYRETGEVLCPHTGVGWQALEGVASRTASAAGQWGRPLVLLATAHAAKFPETVQDVLGVLPPLPRHCADLYERSERIERIEPNLSRLKAYIRAVRAASGPTRS